MSRRKTDYQESKVSGEFLGKRLREIRKSKNISTKTLAAKVGVLDSYIPQLERGSKVPSFDTLICIVNALGVTADELLCDYIDIDKEIIPSNITKKMSVLTHDQQRHIEDLIDMEIKYMTENK